MVLRLQLWGINLKYSKMKTIVFLSLCLMLTSLVKAQTLTVNVSDIHGTGTLMVGIFDSQDSFDNHQIVMGDKIKIDNETTTTQSIFNLNPGTYGVAIWLD